MEVFEISGKLPVKWDNGVEANMNTWESYLVSLEAFSKFVPIGIKYFITASSQVSSVTNMLVKNYTAQTCSAGLKLVILRSVEDTIECSKYNHSFIHTKIAPLSFTGGCRTISGGAILITRSLSFNNRELYNRSAGDKLL